MPQGGVIQGEKITAAVERQSREGFDIPAEMLRAVFERARALVE